MPSKLARPPFWIRRTKLRRLLVATFGLLPVPGWRVVGAVEHADEVPDSLPNCHAYLVGTPMINKWLAFDCPCTTGHRILLNLDPERLPSWRLRTSFLGKITLSPSIDFDDGFNRCHYTIRKGRVVWAADSTNATNAPLTKRHGATQ